MVFTLTRNRPYSIVCPSQSAFLSIVFCSLPVSPEKARLFSGGEHMSKKTIGIVLAALGAIMAVLSLAADAIGLGRDPGIHRAQLLGIAIGIIVAAAGIRQLMSASGRKK
jgi:hypothetical protein